jgi:hypothetical protein
MQIFYPQLTPFGEKNITYPYARTVPTWGEKVANPIARSMPSWIGGKNYAHPPVP